MHRQTNVYEQPLIGSSPSGSPTAKSHRQSRAMHSAYAFQENSGGWSSYDPVQAKRRERQRFFLFRTTRYSFFYWGLLTILLSPIAGLIMIVLAFRERTLRTFSPNPSDWLVMLFIGITLQSSMAAPFTFMASPKAHHEMTVELESGGEYYSAFVFPFVLGIHTLATIFMFIYYRNQYEEENGGPSTAGGGAAGSLGSYFSGGPGTAGGADVAAVNAAGGGGIVGDDHAGYRGGGGMGSAGHPSSNHYPLSHNRPPSSSTEAQKAVDMRNARLIKTEIELSTRQRTEYIIPLGLAIGVCEVFITRICALAATNNCGDKFVTFEVAKFAENDFYTISTVNFMLLFVTFNTSNFFALAIYYQKLLQVREFRYVGTRGVAPDGNSINSGLLGAARNNSQFTINKGGGSSNGSSYSNRTGGRNNTTTDFVDLGSNRRGGAAGAGGGGGGAESLANPENNSTWAITWRQIVIDMKRRPEIRAATNSTFPVVLLVIVVAITYICLYNLTGEGVAQFTTGFVCLIVTCTFVVLGFVYITVQMADAVDFQTKVIAKLQNDMQVRLDEEGPEMDGFHRQLLMAKVRVLQSLDVYLRHSSSKPKLIGLSMESFRWTVIIIGLGMMNVFFFSLYYSHCAHNSRSPQ